MDDTVIRRVRSEDVAEAGGEEDPKVLAVASEQQKTRQDPRGISSITLTRIDIDSADNDKAGAK